MYEQYLEKFRKQTDLCPVMFCPTSISAPNPLRVLTIHCNAPPRLNLFRLGCPRKAFILTLRSGFNNPVARVLQNPSISRSYIAPALIAALLLFHLQHLYTSQSPTMRPISAALLVLAALCAFSKSYAQVLELSQSDFDTHVSKGKPMLLEFYAPWCPHCQNFAPSYAKVASVLHSKRAGISVARVDGDENRVLMQRFRVSEFPTFFLIDGRNVFAFTGSPSVDELVEFASSRGTSLGRRPTAALGPFHLYWRAVGAFVAAADAAATWLDASPRNSSLAAGAAVLGVIGVIAIFALFVHIITKPPPPRAHAE